MVRHPTHKERDNSSHHDFEGFAGFKEAPLFHLASYSLVTKDDEEERQKEGQYEAADETGGMDPLP